MFSRSSPLHNDKDFIRSATLALNFIIANIMCTHSVWKHVKDYNQLSCTMIKHTGRSDTVQFDP